MNPELDAPDLGARVDSALPRTLEDLKKLVAIPSVSSQAEHCADVALSAELVAAWASELGAADVSVVAAGGQPAVIAHWPAPAGKPTICLYAHHDVQPAGDQAAWTTNSYQATQRDGRLYGRGAADDKGGVAVHLAVLRAFDGKPPVGVTLFVEGEEEIGSPTLGAMLERHREALRADAYVITDSTNWEVGQPAFTTMLRGLIDVEVTVSTLRSGVHSGEYGGVVPDALTSLCRLLATLHDADGNVAIQGLTQTEAPDLDYPQARLRGEAGVLDGVQLIGSGSVVQRLWTKPAVSVIGLDSTRIADASSTLIPSASAKVSVRLAPGDDRERAMDAVVRHLEQHAPWGARVSVARGRAVDPAVVAFEGPICQAAAAAWRDAWGRPAVSIGCGGSIGLVAEFAEVFPDAAILITAVTDPQSAMHGIDESLDLGDWGRCVHAEANLLARLGS